MGAKNILITGAPGVGKTTLVKRLADELKGLSPAGFYTSEIREGGVRVGFALASFDGKTGVLSHVDFKGPFRVGRYGVDVKGFEDFLCSLDVTSKNTGVIIIDEIGKMESFSQKFKAFITEALGSGKPVIATIARSGGALISSVKRRPDVVLFELTRANRDSLKDEILKEVGRISR